MSKTNRKKTTARKRNVAMPRSTSTAPVVIQDRAFWAEYICDSETSALSKIRIIVNDLETNTAHARTQLREGALSNAE